jgi:hypothetical protein
METLRTMHIYQYEIRAFTFLRKQAESMLVVHEIKIHVF